MRTVYIPGFTICLEKSEFLRPIGILIALYINEYL